MLKKKANKCMNQQETHNSGSKAKRVFAGIIGFFFLLGAIAWTGFICVYLYWGHGMMSFGGGYPAYYELTMLLMALFFLTPSIYMGLVFLEAFSIYNISSHKMILMGIHVLLFIAGIILLLIVSEPVLFLLLFLYIIMIVLFRGILYLLLYLKK